MARTSMAWMVLGVGAAAGPACGQMIFGDRAEWEAAVSGQVTEDFEGLSVPNLQPSIGTVQLNVTQVHATGQDFNKGAPGVVAGLFQGALFPLDGHTSYVFGLGAQFGAFGIDTFNANSGLGLAFEFGGFTFDVNAAGIGQFEDGFVGLILPAGQFDDQVVLLPGMNPGPIGEIFAADDLSFANPESECYADCTGEGTLDIFDFLCFQDAFVTMDPYADCDGSTVFDIFDFLCFQDEFVMGCP